MRGREVDTQRAQGDPRALTKKRSQIRLDCWSVKLSLKRHCCLLTVTLFTMAWTFAHRTHWSNLIPRSLIWLFCSWLCSPDSVVCPTTMSESGPSPWAFTAWKQKNMRMVEEEVEEEEEEVTWTTISYFVNFWRRRSRKLNLWKGLLILVRAKFVGSLESTWSYATRIGQGRRIGVGSLLQTINGQVLI